MLNGNCLIDKGGIEFSGPKFASNVPRPLSSSSLSATTLCPSHPPNPSPTPRPERIVISMDELDGGNGGQTLEDPAGQPTEAVVILVSSLVPTGLPEEDVMDTLKSMGLNTGHFRNKMPQGTQVIVAKRSAGGSFVCPTPADSCISHSSNVICYSSISAKDTGRHVRDCLKKYIGLLLGSEKTPQEPVVGDRRKRSAPTSPVKKRIRGALPDEEDDDSALVAETLTEMNSLATAVGSSSGAPLPGSTAEFDYSSGEDEDDIFVPAEERRRSQSSIDSADADNERLVLPSLNSGPASDIQTQEGGSSDGGSSDEDYMAGGLSLLRASG